MVSVSGAAVDEMRLNRAAASLQAVLDGATLAAASPTKMTDDQRLALANAYLDKQLSNIADFSKLSGSVKIKNNGNRVQAKVSGTLKTAFMRVVGLNKMSLTGVSVSERIDALGCMIVLNPASSQSLYLNGTADVYAKNCMVQVNSSSTTGLAQVGSSTLTAKSICIGGGYSGARFTPTPQPCKPITDPLASSFAADYATFNTSVCDKYNGNGKPMTLPSGIVNLAPGVYCGGIKVTNNSTAALAAGTYFIKDGELDVRSGGTVTGTGVTIVLIGNSSTDLNVQAGGNLQLKAPASGPFAGVAIAHHPSSIPSSSKGDLVIGGGSIEVEGIVYMPKQVLTITGNGDISMNVKQFALIADTMSIEGNGLLRIGQAADAAGSGLPTLPAWRAQVRILPNDLYVDAN